MKIAIIKKLYHLLSDSSEPLTTHYGAIKGFSALGSQTIENYLLPNLQVYYHLLQPELQDESNLIKRGEAQQCYDALLVD